MSKAELRVGDRWPVELLAELCQLRTVAGLSTEEIARRLGVPVAVLRAKLDMLGWAAGNPPAPPKRGRPIARNWTAARIARLRELWTVERLSTEEIAERLDVSRTAVVSAADRLGLARPPLRRGPKPARTVDEALLKKLYIDERLRREAICERLHITRGALAGLIHRLGLRRERLAACAPRTTRKAELSDGQVIELERLWASSLTRAEIARKIGCTLAAVDAAAARLNLPDRRSLRTVRSPAQRARKGMLPPPSKPKPAPKLPPKRGLCRLTDMPDRQHCHYPIGNPDDVDFRFCGERVAVAGASYCAEHMRACYVAAPWAAPAQSEAA